jgi:hypothetical protein
MKFNNWYVLVICFYFTFEENDCLVNEQRDLKLERGIKQQRADIGKI